MSKLRLAALLILVAFLLLLPTMVNAATWFSCSGSSDCGGSYSNYNGTFQSGVSYNGESVWRWTFPPTVVGGNGIATFWTGQPPSGKTEMWVQWDWQYSSNFIYHGIANKQFYFNPSNVIGMHLRGQYSKQYMSPQGPNGTNYVPNIGHENDPVLTHYASKGVWHKFKARYKMNTGSAYNGIYECWIDDVKIASYTNVYYANGSENLTSGGAHFAVIWGGTGGGPINQTQYLYMKNVYIGDSDPGGSGAGDTSAPYLDTFSPADGATGVLVGTTSASFHAKDSGTGSTGIDITSLDVGGKGCASCGSCDAGLTCSGTSADYTITRTGLSLSYDQVWSENISLSDLVGNAMEIQTYNFTVQADPTPALAVTTTTLPSGTVGTAYSQTLAATGGVSPYTWAVTVGSVPAGLSLSSAGVLSGTPTTAGTSAFTVQATDSDAPANTDTQALSLVVAASLPGGQNTTLGAGINDTYIYNYTPDNNYSSASTMWASQYPAATTESRIIIVDNTDIQSIPDNVVITSATLRMYMTSSLYGGGTNPMRLHAYSISGTLPDVSTVTWNTFAGTLSSGISTTDVSITPGWYEWNVLSAVQTAFNTRAPLYLALDGGADGSPDTNRYFATMEHATTVWRPQLVITYTQLTAPPPEGTRISVPGSLRVSRFLGTMR